MRKLIVVALFSFACSDLPTPINSTPEILSVTSTESGIASDTSVVVECIAIDEDNDELQYTWISEEGSFEGTGSKVNWNPPQRSGLFNIICEVQDPLDGRDKANVYVQVIKYDTLSISFTDLNIFLNSGNFNPGKYYFTSEEEWLDFQIENGFSETELVSN